MELKQINLDKLKQLSGNERAKTISEYEEEKTVLIQEYLRLQDIVDEYNEQIYRTTCKIEQINFVLQAMGHQMSK